MRADLTWAGRSSGPFEVVSLLFVVVLQEGVEQGGRGQIVLCELERLREWYDMMGDVSE